jgi:hypothetical protein
MDLKICVAVKRTGDGQESNNKFAFDYVQHQSSNCFFCACRPDTDQPAEIQVSLNSPLIGFSASRTSVYTAQTMRLNLMKPVAAVVIFCLLCSFFF